MAPRARAADGLDVEEVDVAGWRGACDGLPLSHMGRGPSDDPWFFAAAFAGAAAWGGVGVGGGGGEGGGASGGGG